MSLNLFIFFLLVTNVLSAQNLFQNNPIEIPYNSSSIQLDGKLDDWPEAFTQVFEDTLTHFNETPLYKFDDVYPASIKKSEIKLPRSKNKVVFNAFWNLHELNIALKVYDKHLFAQVDKHGRKPSIYMNDGIEIYIDTRGDSGLKMDINDYQFIVDIKNNSTVYRGDRRLIESSNYTVPKDFDQNVFFKHAAVCFGSINNDNDQDSLYIIEISIPFAAIGFEPKSGWKLKLDVCINDVDYPTDESCIKDNVSICAFPFNWSGYSDFGYPKFWKNISLTGEPAFFELMVKKYGESWFEVYILILLFTIAMVVLLFLKVKKLSAIPRKEELKHASMIFVPSSAFQTEELSHNQKILKTATDYIVKNKNKNLSSEDVAKEIGMSLRTFQRITKEELNCTPTNFINIVKLNLAADYLSQNMGNVTDASYEFGFSDPSYFSKLFKKHFGHLPSDHLRKNNLNIKTRLKKRIRVSCP